MRTFLGLLFIALIALNACEDDFPVEKDVIILTDATFDKAVEKYEYLMVLFYAPWCGHCKKFHPEYEKAAATLRKENLYLAKVDATVEKKLAEKFEIQGFPTVKLLIKGQPMEYTGGRKESEVVNWMRKKTGPATKELKSADEIEKFQKDNEVCVIYFGSKKDEIEEFTKVARKIEDFPFAVVEDNALAAKFAAPSQVVIFKNFDEKKNVLTTIKEKDIEDFVNKYSSPKVMKFDEKAAQIIFGKAQPAIILYADEKSPKWKEYETLMNTISEKIAGKLKVCLTDIKEGMAARLAEYIGIKESELPSVRIADTKGDFRKYNMEGEINEKNILQFIDDWENKKLKPHLKTADEPKDNSADVFVVVGKTFEKEVINNDLDVMLLFYAPWCGHCKALHPKYEEVAKKLKEKNPKLRMAKIDATENEIESVSIQGFPTVKFYPGDKKNKEPLDYNGERTAEDIIKFIKEHAATKIIYEEEKKEEKKDEAKKEEAKKDGEEGKKEDKTADL